MSPRLLPLRTAWARKDVANVITYDMGGGAFDVGKGTRQSLSLCPSLSLSVPLSLSLSLSLPPSPPFLPLGKYLARAGHLLGKRSCA